MNAQDQLRFDALYQQHLTALKLQGRARETIEAYGLAICRIAQYFDRVPDDLTLDELKRYFVDLIDWDEVAASPDLSLFVRHVNS